MAIYATSEPQTPRELIPEGTYVARCYQMLHIGTITETILGDDKILNKVRVGWELPTELKVYKEENGEQPRVISKEYTLSLHEKSALRKDLKAWRGKDFTVEQALEFDVTNLIGAPCLLTITHKPSKDGTKFYEEIASISNIIKGMEVPAALLKPILLEYDNWNEDTFNALPNFIKEKISSSVEYLKMRELEHEEFNQDAPDDLPIDDKPDDLPF